MTILLRAIKFMLPPLTVYLFRVGGFGYRNKKSLFWGSAFFLVYMLPLQIMVIHLMGYHTYSKSATLFIITGSVISHLIVTNDNIPKTLFLLFVSNNATFTVNMLCNGVKHSFGWDYPALIVLLTISLSLLLWVGVRFVAKPLRFMAEEIRGSWVLMLSVPILTCSACVLVTTYSGVYFGDNPQFYSVEVCAIEAIFFLSYINMYGNFKKIYTYHLEQMKLQSNQELTKQRLSMMDKTVEQMSIVQHDRRHFNHILLSLLKTGEADKAISLLEKQTDSMPTKPRRFCRNIAVNAAVSYYVELAKANGIGYDIRLDIPETLPVDELSLVMTVSNLLENAIQAVEKLPKEKRNIRFITVNRGQLLLEVTNPYEGTISLSDAGLPVSPCLEHGKGSRSIADFVKHHNGDLIYTTQGGIFKVQIIL